MVYICDMVDASLLRTAWSLSAYRSSCIFWQPIEGYCGMATVNTMLWYYPKPITNGHHCHDDALLIIGQ